MEMNTTTGTTEMETGTVHTIRNGRYTGRMEQATVTEHPDDPNSVIVKEQTFMGATLVALKAEVFDTEAEARQAAKAAKASRTPRKQSQRHAYGDYGQLTAFLKTR